MSEETYNMGWKRLFDELPIDAALQETGLFNLSANQIKSIGRQEPRLMTKWDTSESRPEILRHREITILPTSRSGYVLVKGSGYQSLPAPTAPIYHPPEKIKTFTTLPWRSDITKESTAIDVAAISSMLKTFTKEDALALTIRGRSGTPVFGFNFRGAKAVHQLTVNHAQIEIDAGFEGDRVWLLEAKIGEPGDFLVRQIFYPWRVWKTLTQKEIIPVFLVYANRAFGFFRYTFRNPENYHSVDLVENQWFTLDAPECIESLDELFEATRAEQPGVGIFPQADTLGTLIAAVELYANETSDTKELSLALGFDERQGQYYTTAAEWIGFVERAGFRRILTERGRKFVAASRTDRFKILFRAIAVTPVFRDAIQQKLNGHEPGTEEIAELILAHDYAKGSTPSRRAKTVIAWLAWLWREHENLTRSLLHQKIG